MSTVLCDEVATVFSVDDELVVGILHRASKCEGTGVLFVVGGRQYRTGAQRQFVRLGRFLASSGFPVFRFDFRGMGDSASKPRHFLDTGSDLTAAIAEFRRMEPQVDRVILWGLCDGASASVVYASGHSGIDAVMMVNPWITTQSGAAKATLKYYYRKRFISIGFWRNLLKGKINLSKSLYSFGVLLVRKLRDEGIDPETESALPDVVFGAIADFDGSVSVIISEKDLTAREFKDEHDRRYQNNSMASPVDQMYDIKADHTFSSPEQHHGLEDLTLAWCNQCVK